MGTVCHWRPLRSRKSFCFIGQCLYFNPQWTPEQVITVASSARPVLVSWEKCAVTWGVDIYRMSQEERSIFWEVIVSVILSKNVYANMCPIPNGFWDRTIWMYNRKIVDKKDILRVRTVSNTSTYCSSDRVGTVYNKCSKIPPSTSVHFATRVKTWRVVHLGASWRSFMQAITSSMLMSSSSRVSTFFLYTSLFIKPYKQKSNGEITRKSQPHHCLNTLPSSPVTMLIMFPHYIHKFMH